MSENGAKKYLWAIEWNNPFTQFPNRGMIFYSITLHPDVKEEDFEMFMKEEAFPAVAGISTRAVFYKPQYLLKQGDRLDDSTGFFQVEDTFKKLDSLGTYKVDNHFFTMLAPEPPSSE